MKCLYSERGLLSIQMNNRRIAKWSEYSPGQSCGEGNMQSQLQCDSFSSSELPSQELALGYGTIM